jgi:hypothetical protein
MHYKVRRRYGQAGWQLRVYKGPGLETSVPKEAWPAGLKSTMTLAEARTYVKSLNASVRISAEEARRLGAESRKRRRRAIVHAFLPENIVLQFERIYLGTNAPEKRYNIWEAARRLIHDVGLHPSDWLMAPDAIYAWFAAEGYSYDFSKRVIRALNKYGHLYCRLTSQAFAPIDRPTSEQKVAIDENQEDDLSSEPLAREALSQVLKNLSPECGLWVQYAFWFGLRPHEVDQLVAPYPRTPKLKMPTWSIEGDVLVVYQPKLRASYEEDRFKRIPAETPEQGELLTLLATHPLLKRPTVRQARKAFPEGVTLYGCRHGFAMMLDAKPVDRRIISEWLGHKSLGTTEKYYLRLGRNVKRAKVA